MIFHFLQTNDPYGAVFDKKQEIMSSIAEIIKQMNMFKKLEIEEWEKLEAARKLAERSHAEKMKENRMQEFSQRSQQIEEKEKDRCEITKQLLKEIERNNLSGTYFQILLEVLKNFAGNNC